MAKRKTPEPRKWQVTGMLMLHVRSKTKILALMVYPDTGVIMALEAQRFEATGDVAQDAEQVFGEHAHKVIGTEKHLPRAIELAEAYAKGWLEGEIAEFEQCDCGEIEARPRE